VADRVYQLVLSMHQTECSFSLRYRVLAPSRTLKHNDLHTDKRTLAGMCGRPAAWAAAYAGPDYQHLRARRGPGGPRTDGTPATKFTGQRPLPNIVLSLLCGIRTEEARALHWAHMNLDGDPATRPPVPPHVAVWRSVRAHGETNTERSRRTLALPVAAVQALRTWTASQAGERLAAGDDWQDTGLVFTTHHGAALDAGNVRKMFKRICDEAGIGDAWTPRELRTSFVSLMSHRGVSIEEIGRLVGHASTRTTEIVYRRELRPVITTGAEIMDELFTGT